MQSRHSQCAMSFPAGRTLIKHAAASRFQERDFHSLHCRCVKLLSMLSGIQRPLENWSVEILSRPERQRVFRFSARYMPSTLRRAHSLPGTAHPNHTRQRAHDQACWPSRVVAGLYSVETGHRAFASEDRAARLYKDHHKIAS